MSKLQRIEIAGDTINSVTLPEHLIIDHILPRLPVKTLTRFKSVSKFWLLSISSGQFIKSHLEYSSSSSTGQFLILSRNRNRDNRLPFKLTLLPYDELNNPKTPVDFGFPLCSKPSTNRLGVVGSSNGLVCLHIFTVEEVSSLVPSFDVFYRHSCSSFYVCNPATRSYCHIDNPLFIPATPAYRPTNNPDFERGIAEWFWFGYIPSIDDYRIVCSFIYFNGNGRHVYVYSLRTRKWKIIYDIVENFQFGYDCLCESTTIFDDVLYWSLCETNTSERPKRIIGLDLVNERLKEAPWMDWLSKYYSADFFVLNGCLSLLCFSHPYRQFHDDVWTLRKQDDWSSWEKSFSVNLQGMPCVRAVTPTGKFFLQYDRNQCKVASLSKDSKELSQGDDVYISEECIHTAIGYVESLVSPFRPF